MPLAQALVQSSGGNPFTDPEVAILIAFANNGGTNFQKPLTGGLNQSIFTWTIAPNMIVIDNVPRQKVQTDGTINWTGTTTTTLTASVPLPTFDIFAA